MSHSLYVLVAVLAASAGGAEPMPVGPAEPVATAPAVVTSSPTAMPVYGYPVQQQQKHEQPGFLGRLKNKLFGKKQGCDCQHQQPRQRYQPMPQQYPQYDTNPQINPEPPLADQPSLRQTSYAQVPIVRIPPQTAQLAPAQPEQASEEAQEATEDSANPGDQEIKKKYIDRVGHEDDYSWVTGQLYSVRTGSSSVWVVRYATVDTEDKFGGSVVLAPAVNMKNFREGDLVSVKGEVISDGRANKYLGGPLYRVLSIDMIERAD